MDGQLGLEPTPEAYVENLVTIFGEVRRVLRDDGTLWLNLGDSYAGSWGAQSRGGPPSDKSTLRGNGHVGGGPKVNELSEVQVREAPKQESEPQLVLDPFCGAGTTGVVCTKLGRRFLGIELNPEYAEMAERRIMDTNPSLFREAS